MTTDEAAARLNLRPVTVQRHCQEGHIAATKHGRDWWITEAALQAFIQTRRGRGKPRRPPTPPWRKEPTDV